MTREQARFVNLTRDQRERFDELIRRIHTLDVATKSPAVIARREQLNAELEHLVANADAIELETRRA